MMLYQINDRPHAGAYIKLECIQSILPFGGGLAMNLIRYRARLYSVKSDASEDELDGYRYFYDDLKTTNLLDEHG